jgi:predicted RecB family nuclease
MLHLRPFVLSRRASYQDDESFLPMTITPRLFEAYLKCPTKCWLRSISENSTGNAYAEWVETQNESYLADGMNRLLSGTLQCACTVASETDSLKGAKWLLAVDVPGQTREPPFAELRNRRKELPISKSEAPNSGSEINQSLVTSVSRATVESRLHAVERIPAKGQGKPAQFIPTRFVFRNKVGKYDKLLLAFDALVLSETLRRTVGVGKIIHGDNHSMQKVRIAALGSEVRKHIEKIAALLSTSSPPDLVLNRHCVECEFQFRCRQKAIEKDDLNLLSGITDKERKKLHSEGIFTVTQLSYTFRPRRRPKKLRDKREKYHHSLKALAIREKKIYIVGSPKLKVEGMPVYLDVEGLPDRDFYYLIGMRIGNGKSAVQHSLWADSVADERRIWNEFLDIVAGIENPMLIHYGSYEMKFFEQMDNRYSSPAEGTPEGIRNRETVNLLQEVLGQVYFPTYSNSLKDIATWLGFAWSDTSVIGKNSLTCRCEWERTRNPSLKAKLVAYNAEDCQAAEIVTEALLRLRAPDPWGGSGENQAPETVYVQSLTPPWKKFGTFESPVQEFEGINQAAQWDYQRDRIYVKSSNLAKRAARRSTRKRLSSSKRYPVNKVVECSALVSCPFCGGESIPRGKVRRTLHDLMIGRSCIKRWIVEYRFRNYWCPSCRRRFGTPEEFWPQSKFGWNLVAYLLYENFDSRIPLQMVVKTMARFFGFEMPPRTFYALRDNAAKYYKTTCDAILSSLASGNLLHADETQVSVGGKSAYVWVFSNLDEVAYVYTESRDGSFLQEMLKDFRGVLVSDFYGAYDSLPCCQQKCLVHLMRDLNDEVLCHPYDDDLKVIVKEFAELLKAIVETVDQRGLKARFLRRHHRSVEHFYNRLFKRSCQSEQALKCKQRFEKNRDKLFTFLNYDGVPWNNNNAEHAVKAFAKLRNIVRGSFTPNTIQKHLVLLSVCQTCKYMGVDFLDFLRSREKDIRTFAESRQGRWRRSQTNQGRREELLSLDRDKA